MKYNQYVNDFRIYLILSRPFPISALRFFLLFLIIIIIFCDVAAQGSAELGMGVMICDLCEWCAPVS